MFPIYFPIFFLLSSNMFVHNFPVKLPFEKEFSIAMLGTQMVIWNNMRPLFFSYMTLKNGLGWSKVSWGDDNIDLEAVATRPSVWEHAHYNYRSPHPTPS